MLKVITFLRVLSCIPFTNQRAGQRESWASRYPLSSPWAGLWQYNQSSDIICQEKKCSHARCSTESGWASAPKSYLPGGLWTKTSRMNCFDENPSMRLVYLSHPQSKLDLLISLTSAFIFDHISFSTQFNWTKNHEYLLCARPCSGR